MLHLRMVLVGKSGAGKSASGNTILGKEDFKEDDSADSVTVVSSRQSAERFGRQFSVIDTPGLFGTSMDEEQVKKEIDKCICLSVPGPHVFLLVVKLGRFTQEEKSAVQWIQKHFGEEASRYTMVLFTCADQIKKKSVEGFLNSSKLLQELIHCCGGRYHIFNNDDEQNITQVTELMQKIEKMVQENGGEHYTNEMYKEAERKIREEETNWCKAEKWANAKKYGKGDRLDTEKMSDLRMVLVGKSGAGKSASGNTILGKKAFKEHDSADSVTMVLSKQSAVHSGRLFSVIDTPGLFNTSMNGEEVKKQIDECIRLLAPGPHVFLLVVRLGRFTKEERSAVQSIQKNFGEEASRYTMVLFTGADQIKKTSAEEFLNGSKLLQELLHCCGRRYHIFNNDDKQNITQVTELMQKIEKMVKENGEEYYTYEMYKEAERKIREEEERRIRDENWENMKTSFAGAVCGALAVTAAGAVIMKRMNIL